MGSGMLTSTWYILFPEYNIPFYITSNAYNNSCFYNRAQKSWTQWSCLRIERTVSLNDPLQNEDRPIRLSNEYKKRIFIVAFLQGTFFNDLLTFF